MALTEHAPRLPGRGGRRPACGGRRPGCLGADRARGAVWFLSRCVAVVAVLGLCRHITSSATASPPPSAAGARGARGAPPRGARWQRAGGVERPTRRWKEGSAAARGEAVRGGGRAARGELVRGGGRGGARGAQGQGQGPQRRGQRRAARSFTAAHEEAQRDPCGGGRGQGGVATFQERSESSGPLPPFSALLAPGRGQGGEAGELARRRRSINIVPRHGASARGQPGPQVHQIRRDVQKVLKHNFDTKITSTINSSNCKVPGVAILVCLQSRFAMSRGVQLNNSKSMPVK